MIVMIPDKYYGNTDDSGVSRPDPTRFEPTVQPARRLSAVNRGSTGHGYVRWTAWTCVDVRPKVSINLSAHASSILHAR